MDVLTCRTFSDDGRDVICDKPAEWIVWGHLYDRRDKGPKCWKHLPRQVREQGITAFIALGAYPQAIYKIPDQAEVARAAAEKALREAADQIDWRFEVFEAADGCMAIREHDKTPGQLLTERADRLGDEEKSHG